jgi:hypothetical protein
VVRAWAKHWGPILSTTNGYTHVSSLLEGLGENIWRVSVPALEGLE